MLIVASLPSSETGAASFHLCHVEHRPEHWSGPQHVRQAFPVALSLKHLLTSLPFLVQTLARGFRTRMFHLRTCAAKLRPLTASQTVRTFSQNRPAAARTFGQIRCYTAPVAAEPFLSGTSSNYVEEMYYAWLENPKSVHKVRLSERTSPCIWRLGLVLAGRPGKCAQVPWGRPVNRSPTDQSSPCWLTTTATPPEGRSTPA